MRTYLAGQDFLCCYASGAYAIGDADAIKGISCKIEIRHAIQNRLHPGYAFQMANLILRQCGIPTEYLSEHRLSGQAHNVFEFSAAGLYEVFIAQRV